MTVLGLSGDITKRLVENNGHAFVLLILGLSINLDLLIRTYLTAEFADNFSVDFDPAFGNPLVGFPSGT